MFTGDTHRRMRVGNFHGSIASLYLNNMDLLKEPVNNLTDEQFYKAFKEAKIKYKKPTLQFSDFLVILVQNGIISMNKVVSLINYERNERK